MVEVHFNNIHEQIIDHLSTAKRDIKICVAWFTDEDIYNAILRSQQKGVIVNVVIANHEFNTSSKVDFKRLLENNGYVGYIGNINDCWRDKLMHNKFCIIDNEKVITGSYNWTFKARKNDENIIIIQGEEEVVKKFIEKFEMINPQYGLAMKGNAVELLPIEEIMAKWSKPASTTQIVPTISEPNNIVNKF